MHCQNASWSATSSQLREAWPSISARSAWAASPFFAWEFFEAVDRLRHDLEVVVLREAGEIVGCFPFQRRGSRRAIPVAALVNDLHGPLAPNVNSDDFADVLRSAGLNRFNFHAAPTLPWTAEAVTREFDAYRARLGRSGGEYLCRLAAEHYTIRQQERKARAMERCLGPLRLEWQTRDTRLLDVLIAWKRQYYRRIGAFDIFSLPWVGALLNRLLQLPLSGMNGQLSALYSGERVVALHYGLRLGDAIHSWFPAYSAECARFSPGIEAFLRLAERAPSEGVTLLDLGCGSQSFKLKLSNERYSLRCGSLDLVPWRRTLRTWSRWSRGQARRLPWSPSMQVLLRRASLSYCPSRYQ